MRACKFSFFFFLHWLIFFGTPADIYAVQPFHLSVLIFLLILCHWATISYWQFLQMMWRSWEGRRRHECIAPANLEKPKSFSVMRLQPSLTLPHMPWQFSCWLIATLTVGLFASDLLIKFVFTPRELVGCTSDSCYVCCFSTISFCSRSCLASLQDLSHTHPACENSF